MFISAYRVSRICDNIEFIGLHADYCDCRMRVSLKNWNYSFCCHKHVRSLRMPGMQYFSRGSCAFISNKYGDMQIYG